MREIANWNMQRLSELSEIGKCGCGKTKDPNGWCDGSHSTLTKEEIDKLNKKSLVKTKKYVSI
jgi:CDGSH-type Zn-finger protein